MLLPFPLYRFLSGSEYYGSSAPAAPAGDDGPTPLAQLVIGRRGPVTAGSHVHRVLDRQGRHLALSPQYRREYAVVLPRGLPDLIRNSVQGVPAGTSPAVRTATQPVFARFELVEV